MEAIVIERTLAASVLVRVIAREDAAAVAELSGELGYEASVGEIAERIEFLLSQRTKQTAFVACVE